MAPGLGPPPKSYASALANSASAADQLSYKQATEAAKTAQLILLVKGTIEEGSGASPPDHQSWANVIFDVLEFLPDDVSGVHFRSDGPMSSEVEVINAECISKYAGLTKTHDGVRFQVSKLQEGEDLITFKDVPLSIPDCELIHLVKSYGGQMEKEEVHYKKETIKSAGGVEITLDKSSTRYIYATLPANKRLRSYYWIHGVGASDNARRILTIHKNQESRQCGNCLRTARDPFNHCRFGAKTSACKKNAPQDRMSLSVYLKQLREVDNYVSLRTVCRWASDEEEEVELSTKPTVWANEPSTLSPELDRENLMEESNELRSKLNSERTKIKKVKKQSDQAKRELSSLQLGGNQRMRALREKVSENIRKSQPEWESDLKFLATMLAGNVSLIDFDSAAAAKGELVPKVNLDPMESVRNLLDNVSEVEQTRLDELVEEVEKNLLPLLTSLGPQRTRSVSRSREESSGGEETECKSAKSSRLASPAREGWVKEQVPDLSSLPGELLSGKLELSDGVSAVARGLERLSSDVLPTVNVLGPGDSSED